MALWPAAKMGDMVVGIDIHKVLLPIVLPVPPPVPTPHPYFGTIFLWLTPQFPKMNVFINGVPAVATGAMGYSCHIPLGAPIPPFMLNMEYFRRHLLNIPKQLVLVALTMFANMAIGKIAGIFIDPKSDTAKFVQECTGTALSQEGTVTESIKGGLSAYTKWQTWAKLLIPPLPFPGAQGSSAIGSPTVQVNGGALGFVAPLMSASCTEFIWVPNAATIGFSNVMVGVSFAAMAKALAAHASQAAVSKAVSAGFNRATQRRQGQAGCGCPR